jgi:hypothetical protein
MLTRQLANHYAIVAYSDDHTKTPYVPNWNKACFLGIKTQWMNNSSIKLFRIQSIEIVQFQIKKKNSTKYTFRRFFNKIINQPFLVIFHHNILEIKVKLQISYKELRSVRYDLDSTTG